jgi:hypothetical protein
MAADPSSTGRADLDLEKGGYEVNSDLETAKTIVSEPGPEPAVGHGATAGESEGAGQEDSANENKDGPDPNIVTWDGPDDPLNPMNWTMRKKWSNIAVLSFLTLLT